MPKRQHPFLKEREAKSLYIVCRIDDYTNVPNERGGFAPGRGEYLKKGGFLWLTQEQAENAARYVLQNKEGGQQFGIFKLVSIVEEVVTPVRVVQL